MKKCKDCGIEKPLNEFTIIQKRYPNSYCKSCATIRTKKYENKNPDRLKKYYQDNRLTFKANRVKFNKAQKDGYHYVYHIADGNYVGVTENKYFRKQYHKTINKRDLEKGTGFQILYRTPSRSEALEVESKLHALGFNG